MKLLLIGLNHKTSRIDVREKFFLSQAEKEVLLTELKYDPSVMGAFVISTCNRTEIYAQLIDDRPEILLDILFKVKNIEKSPDLLKHFYIIKGNDFINHLFEVTCGLDSLVIGEKQILGQIKQAAELAKEKGMLSKVFNILLNICLSAGKAAQSKTEISQGGCSISWAAVATAQKIFGSLDQKNILIIGAGKMSQLTANQLLRKSISNIYVTNRTFKKAQDLAKQIGGTAVMFWDLKNILTKIDICICSAGASYFLIEPEDVKNVMMLRNHSPLVLIDIATPRNINPEVGLIPGVQLITIDDLQMTVDEHLQERQKSVIKVKEIIEGKISFFNAKIQKGSYFQSEVQTSVSAI